MNYPDGKCYICRRGECFPGERCPECDALQPDYELFEDQDEAYEDFEDACVAAIKPQEK